MTVVRVLRSPVLRTTFRTMSSSAGAGAQRISEAIVKDHRELKQYYDEVLGATSHDHQKRFGNQFTWELARHSVGEELVVYPALEKYLGSKGKELAEHDRQAHHETKLHLKEFQNKSQTSPVLANYPRQETQLHAHLP
jgi:hemerythrin superfamily protein